MKRSDAHHGAGILPVMKYLLLVLTVVLVRQSVLAADKKSSLAEDKKSSTKEEPALPLPAEPKHGRPYMMPEAERQRIRGLIAREGWAKQDYEQLKKKAEGGDGYAAAFLFALERDAKYVPAATKWLLAKFAPHRVKRFKDRLDDPKFFAGARPWMGVILYRIYAEQIIAFDLSLIHI